VKKLLFIFLLAFPLLAIPELTGPVVDEANLLSPADKARIEEKLYAMDKEGLAQIAVFIAASLEDQDVASFSLQVVEKWKLGKKQKDTGLLILIAPKERKMRIEVGYGLEGTIPDARAKKITSTILVPAMKRGAAGEGILDALNAIDVLLHKEASATPADETIENPPMSTTSRVILIIFFIIALMLVIPAMFLSGGSHYNRRRNSWDGGGWGSGGDSFGGGWGGGSGGGGFSGGGGSFGGGGASDSW